VLYEAGMCSLQGCGLGRTKTSDLYEPVCTSSSGLNPTCSSCSRGNSAFGRPSAEGHAMIFKPEGTIPALQPLSIVLICPPRSTAAAILGKQRSCSPGRRNPVRGLAWYRDDPVRASRKTCVSVFPGRLGCGLHNHSGAGSTTRCSFAMSKALKFQSIRMKSPVTVLLHGPQPLPMQEKNGSKMVVSLDATRRGLCEPDRRRDPRNKEEEESANLKTRRISDEDIGLKTGSRTSKGKRIEINNR